MGYGDGARGTLKFLPVGNVAKEDISKLFLGKLQLTTGLVVCNGYGAANHGDLNNATANFGSLCILDWFVGCAEINRSSYKLTHTSARANRLIVNLATAFGVGVVGKPALVNGSWKRCTGTTDGGLGKHGQNCGSAKGRNGTKSNRFLGDRHGSQLWFKRLISSFS